MADGKVPERLREEILARDNYTCQLCGLKGYRVKRSKKAYGFGYYTERKGIYLSIDHIYPVSLGGTNSPQNLRVLCTRCNLLKGTRADFK
jgi:5-methylcytosine-specific restriction protein A